MKLSDSDSVNLLVKAPGTRCNFSCAYCFEHLKKQENKQQGIVEMNDVVEAVRSSDKKVNVVFHGGEPLLLPLTYYRELLNALSLEPNLKHVHIQTNGSLLTREHIECFWGEFKHLNIEIAISLDGNASQNDLRRDTGKKATFERVRKSFALLEEHGIKAGMLSVLHRSTLGQAEEYTALLESIPNINFVKLNALHLLEGDGLTPDSISPSEFITLCCQIHASYMEKRLYERFPIEPFLGAMQSKSDIDSKYCNFSFRKCHNFISLYPKGVFALCDSLPLEEFKIEHMGDREKHHEVLNPFLTQCDHCDIAHFCKGGCISTRWQFKDIDWLGKDYCESRHLLHEYISQIL